jgi:Putative beta barrel porin-7 (BBP7)
MIGKLPWAVCVILLTISAAPAHQIGEAVQDSTLPAQKEPGKTDAAVPSGESLESALAAPCCDPKVFVSVDYLLWWIRRGPTPPLVTAGPDDGVATGALGEASTQVIFGQRGIDYGTFSGVRLSAGWNFGPCDFWGLEASGVLLQPQTVRFAASSGGASGTPLLARPFLATTGSAVGEQLTVPNFEASVLVASNLGGLQGAVLIDSHTQFWSYDVNLVAHSIRDGNRRFDVFCGFRSLGLDENLDIDEDLKLLQDGATVFQTEPLGQGNFAVAPGFMPLPGMPGQPLVKDSTITIIESFKTHNQFYGGQLGGRFQWRWGCLSLDLTGKLALGVTHQQVSIFGVSKLDQPGAPEVVTPGGVLALVTNMGDYQRDRFSVVPELDLNVLVDITSHIRAKIGYSGLYWSTVARPGNEIDRDVNPLLVPSGVSYTNPPLKFDPNVDQSRPRFQFSDNGFWAQGLDFGIELRF